MAEEKEYFMWEENNLPHIYICVGQKEGYYLWEMVYDCGDPQKQGTIYEASSPETYKGNGRVKILNKAQVALVILQGKEYGK